MKSPGEEAIEQAKQAAKAMNTWEFFKMRKRNKRTLKRLRNNKPVEPRGYHPNLSVKIGSFGDMDYGN